MALFIQLRVWSKHSAISYTLEASLLAGIPSVARNRHICSRFCRAGSEDIRTNRVRSSLRAPPALLSLRSHPSIDQQCDCR